MTRILIFGYFPNLRNKEIYFQQQFKKKKKLTNEGAVQMTVTTGCSTEGCDGDGAVDILEMVTHWGLPEKKKLHRYLAHQHVESVQVFFLLSKKLDK